MSVPRQGRESIVLDDGGGDIVELVEVEVKVRWLEGCADEGR